MEGLVNYSSEDEQEETMNHKTAERGSGGRSPGKQRRTYGMDSAMTGDNSNSGGKRGTSTARNINFKNEDSHRHKTSYGSANRQTSSTFYSRDNKRDSRDDRRDSRDHVRDHREERELRDSRHTKDQSRYDHKFQSDRTRTREYQNDHKRERDNYDNRRPREDDRHRSSTSYNKNSRFSGNGRDERSRNDTSSSNPTSLRQHNSNRSFDHRHSEHYDRASDRYRRRSNSRSPSPSSAPRPHHSKRVTNDEKSYSRHRTRSRSRSATPARPDSRERLRGGFALEQARLSALEMERKIQPANQASQIKQVQTSQAGVRSTEALLSLPLSDTAPKQPNVIAVAPVSTSFNNGGEPAVIQLPSYYNPNVINPNRYAEQVQKRKLLWGAKKSEDTAAKWGKAQFSQDSDGKVASKFMRLMGIKGNGPTKAEGEEVETKVVPTEAPDVKTREVMFSNMEQQYEVARQVTHTMRGVGLGFSSQARPF